MKSDNSSLQSSIDYILKAKKIWFEHEHINLETTGNRTAKMPLCWFSKLKEASDKERMDFEIWSEGSWIHWENIGEDLSVEGFFTFKGKCQTKKL